MSDRTDDAVQALAAFKAGKWAHGTAFGWRFNPPIFDINGETDDAYAAYLRSLDAAQEQSRG